MNGWVMLIGMLMIVAAWGVALWLFVSAGGSDE